jgi:hypothetical protein
MTALLIRRRRPIGEPSGQRPTAWTFASTLDGTRGAGRVCMALTELGVALDPLTQVVIDGDVAPADLDRLDLGRRHGTVVLGSHLVNLPEDDARVAFLRGAARHAADPGVVLVEHHPLDWAETAEATTPTPGADLGMDEVRRHPPYVSAVSTFDFGGQYVRQPFTARVLSEDELNEVLADAGLTRTRRLSPTWLEASLR